jgi:hypothetical protein
VQSQCNLLIEDYTDLFYIIDKGDNPSIQCKVKLRQLKSVIKQGLSLMFINFYVPELKTRLSSTENSLQLSENSTPRSSMCLWTIFRIAFLNSLTVVDKRLIGCKF